MHVLTRVGNHHVDDQLDLGRHFLAVLLARRLQRPQVCIRRRVKEAMDDQEHPVDGILVEREAAFVLVPAQQADTSGSRFVGRVLPK